ncbi:MAG: GPW/gp25 family protein [Synergistaceae bacterium]|jgi:phage baseplate assembly protein W|nr:GPW/gp25 family protein [Synergistaceae bacterium]
MSRTPEDGRFAVMEPLAHIRQSVMDIVTTPIGTRVMLPEYGSKVPRLVDNPVTQSWKLEVYSAVADALHRWEPRVQIERVQIDAVGPGYVELTVRYRLQDGTYEIAGFTVGE